jgi:hypothetical protein
MPRAPGGRDGARHEKVFPHPPKQQRSQRASEPHGKATSGEVAVQTAAEILALAAGHQR